MSFNTNNLKRLGNQFSIPISADGLGFQVLHPACEGACEITLRWTGRPDRIPSAIVSLGALVLLVGLAWRNPRIGIA